MRVFCRSPVVSVAYRYLDSVHAALIAGLTETGVESHELVGESAQNWWFCREGVRWPRFVGQPDGGSKVNSG